MSVRAELARVVELASLTPRPWKAEWVVDEWHVCDTHGAIIAVGMDDHSSELIAAAVNFLRQHHAALAAAVEDGERYRWLRDNADMQFGENGVFAGFCIFQPTTYQPSEIDAAIDRARDGGGE